MQETEKQFICSICIPTYSRAPLLRRTLESIVREQAFKDGKVEIVVSDNVSVDETMEVGQSFSRQYPDRIRYHRHDAPIDAHFNFEYALNKGSGRFLKLNNDNFAFSPGGLDRLVKDLEQYGSLGSIFLPENHQSADEEYEVINSVDELVDKLSYWITTINRLCLNREVYHKLEDPFRAWKIHFPHVDILFRLLNQGEKAVRLNHIETVWQFIRHDSKERNEAENFAEFYISLLHEQYTMGNLSRKTYQKEKCRTLFKHTIPVHFDFFHQFNTSRKPLPFWRHTKYYRKDWFFYVALVWIAFYWFISNVIPIHQMLGKIKRFLLKKKNPQSDKT